MLSFVFSGCFPEILNAIQPKILLKYTPELTDETETCVRTTNELLNEPQNQLQNVL